MSHPPTTWEYLTVQSDPRPDADTLDRLGRDAWELAAASGATLYFKRPGPDFRERVTIDQKRHVYSAIGESVDRHGNVISEADGGR